tara:strand:+ start:257 stop:412 length:156 start_codon:yes stop_codon:yes gene_type:complete
MEHEEDFEGGGLDANKLKALNAQIGDRSEQSSYNGSEALSGSDNYMKADSR